MRTEIMIVMGIKLVHYIVAMLLLLFLLMVYDSKKAEFDKFFIVIGARAYKSHLVAR